MKKIVVSIGLFLSSYSAVHASVIKEPPANPDPNARYIFLMFGLQTELLGPDSYNQHYQKRYETTALSKTFSNLGYTVIVEMRPRNTVSEEYAAKVATQVRQLISQGVKPSNIVLAGHSKGAIITLVAAGLLSQPEIKYVVMAGCALPTTTRIANQNPRQNFVGYLDNIAPKAQGKMLSIYDKEDTEFQTCREYQRAAPNLIFTENVIDSGSAPGKGHAAFYSPDPKWLSVVTDWLKD